jgi:hypothetical protein
METRHTLCAFAITLALPVLLLLPGCGSSGPEVVPVSGQVLVDGQPLTTGIQGYVRVMPEGARAATGNIDPQTGRFSLTTWKAGDGCVRGTHRVTVHMTEMVGPEAVSLIPERYSDPAESGLTVTIDGPTDSLAIEISGPVQKARGTPADDMYADPERF